MIFFQWAVLPEGRQHRTVKALYDGAIRLCFSDALFHEVRSLLVRPELLRDSLPRSALIRSWRKPLSTRIGLRLSPGDLRYPVIRRMIIFSIWLSNRTRDT